MARGRTDAPDTVKNAPAIDLGTLAGSVKPSRVTSSNPFVPILRDSYKAAQAGENGWLENTVPGYHVRRFASALRNATQSLVTENIGVRIRYAFKMDDGTEVEKGDIKIVPEDERPVTVKFCGRTRKDYSGGDDGNDDVNGDDGDDTDDDSDLDTGD